MLSIENTILLGIDIQEKLVLAVQKNKEIAEDNFIKLVMAAKILNIKTILTEQYPKGLGATIEPIIELLKEDYKPYEKTSFCAVLEENISDEIINSNKKQILLFGIEAHICVFQTAIELKEKGYEVFVISDCTYSRNKYEKEAALEILRHRGIMTPTLEMVLFMWLKSSRHKNFKEIQNLIK